MKFPKKGIGMKAYHVTAVRTGHHERERRVLGGVCYTLAPNQPNARCVICGEPIGHEPNRRVVCANSGNQQRVHARCCCKSTLAGYDLADGYQLVIRCSVSKKARGEFACLAPGNRGTNAWRNTGGRCYDVWSVGFSTYKVGKLFTITVLENFAPFVKRWEADVIQVNTGCVRHISGSDARTMWADIMDVRRPQKGTRSGRARAAREEAWKA